MDVLSSSSKLYHHAGGERGNRTKDVDDDSTAAQLRLITNSDFLRLVRKALLGDYFLAVLQIFYAIWVGNFFHHILVSCWIVQFWFVIFIWCVALPLVQQHEDGDWQPQQQHAVLFWAFLPMLLVLSAGALLRTNYSGQNLEFVLGGIVCYVASAIVAVMVCLALREIRNTMAKVYAGDTLITIRAKALQCTRDAMKVGLIQMCLFTIAMMGIGFTTEKELISTMMRRQYAGGNGNPNQMIEDQELVGLVLQGYKAGLVGFVLNIFLIQSIVSNHIPKAPTLIDLLSGNYLWLEFVSAVLQMILVVSITLIVATIAPSDFVPFSNIDTTFLQSRLLQLIMFGVFLPAFLLLLLIIYFCIAYRQESSSSGQFLRQRQRQQHKKIQLGGGGTASNQHRSTIISGMMPPFDDHGFESDYSDKLDYSQSATSSTQPQELEQESQMLAMYEAELERSNNGMRSMAVMSSSSSVFRGAAAGQQQGGTGSSSRRQRSNRYCSPDTEINVI